MMMPKLVPLGLLCAALGLAACEERNPVQTEASDLTGNKPMILNLRGTAVGEPRTLTINGVPTQNSCFTVDLIDMTSGRVVGKATDCIAAKKDDQHASGLEVVGTTIFDFGEGHSFTSRGLTTVQATTHGSPGITHITGAVPPQGENSIVGATGRFQNLKARVRLGGAVDMSRMATENRVFFDCMFVVHPL